MSDGSLDATSEAPARKPTPWSVRKIVEQVTGKPLESMQDPPGSRKPSRSSASASRDLPLERYHEENGPAVTVLVAREEEPELRGSETAEPEPSRREKISLPSSSKGDRSPSLRAFLPGTAAPAPSSGRGPKSPSLPLTRPLPLEVVEEVERLREEEGAPSLPALEPGHGHKRTELERVYLSYLLMHLDKLTEPALKYLQHAVEEECEERGLSR